MKILVMSCDKDQDLFEAFHHCMEKYWPDHPEIIYSTETVKNPYYKTICKNIPVEKWTKRIHDTVSEIDDDQVLLMVGDVFLLKPVGSSRVNEILNVLSSDKHIASINLHRSHDKKDIEYNSFLKRRHDKGEYKTSIMCSVWNKENLLDVMSCEMDPWKFELANNSKGYIYLIVKDQTALDWGYPDRLFGVFRGKWIHKTAEQLKNEGLNIDYSKRGYYD